MRANGAYCLLVSGGFSLFADRVAAEIGFDAAVSNRLDIVEGGRLAGTVARPIVGAEGKRQALLDAAAARGIPLAETLAVGDGANDIPMLEAAGLGIAYHAKPAAAAAADARIEANDLTALLYAQGYARKEWVRTTHPSFKRKLESLRDGRYDREIPAFAGMTVSAGLAAGRLMSAAIAASAKATERSPQAKAMPMPSSARLRTSARIAPASG